MFKFRFQSVLEYREFLENLRKMDLAEKQKKYITERERGEFLRKRRIEYHEAMRTETGKEELQLPLLASYHNYVVVIENQIIIQDDKTATALEEVKKSQKILMEARKQKEVMVKLKEKDLEKYKYELEMKNQKALDEVANVRFMRLKKQDAEYAAERKTAV